MVPAPARPLRAPAAGVRPPLESTIAAWKAVFGESLASIRILPALCNGVVVWLAGLFAREAGGARWAQTLAALAALVTPIYLGITRFFSMNAQASTTRRS